MRLAAPVLAGFWPQPIQWIGVALGVVCSLVALGIQGFILALIGECLGRIQRDVEGRPLYAIERELGCCQTLCFTEQSLAR